MFTVGTLYDALHVQCWFWLSQNERKFTNQPHSARSYYSYDVPAKGRRLSGSVSVFGVVSVGRQRKTLIRTNRRGRSRRTFCGWMRTG